MSTGDEVGDNLLSRLMSEHDNLEQQLEHFHHVGRCIGAVYNGLVREGTPEHDALELTSNWMECHIFDRIDKYVAGGIVATDDTDDDSEDDE